MKRKIKTIGRILLIVVLIFFTLAVFRFAHIQMCFSGLHLEFYDGKHTEAYMPPLPSDYFTAQNVLKTADEAFSIIQYESDEQKLRSELEKKYGKLAYYCVMHQEDAVSEKHKINLLTANFKDDSGYMWVMYYHTAYDENGKVTYGSGGEDMYSRIPARWELEKRDGEWTVVGIIEHP